MKKQSSKRPISDARGVLDLIRASAEFKRRLVYARRIGISYLLFAIITVASAILSPLDFESGFKLCLLLLLPTALAAFFAIGFCGMKLRFLLRDPDGYLLGSAVLDTPLDGGRYLALVTWEDGTQTRVQTRRIASACPLAPIKQKHYRDKRVTVGYHPRTGAFFTRIHDERKTQP